MISVFLDGRLGNQMFQYAVCRIVAEKNGYSFFIPNGKYDNENDNPHLWMGDDIFDLNLGIQGSYNRVYQDSQQQNFNPKIFEVPDGTLLRGYFQTEKYYDEYEDKVKSWFKVKPCDESDSLIRKYEDYCFIHFRGGDYLKISQYFLPKKYYDDAKKESGFSKFVIVTDDPIKAKEYFPDDIIESNSMKVDFNLLYNAKNLIISNSSFSWWAGWLNENNNVIAPLGWFNYNVDKNFNPTDIKTKKFRYI
jgi:hypothetical protein